MLSRVLAAMDRYYRPRRRGNPPPACWLEAERRLDDFRARHPGAPNPALRAELYRVLAEGAEPVIFDDSPFFFELGLRYAENWGTPEDPQPGSYLHRHWGPDTPEEAEARARLWDFALYNPRRRALLWCCYGDHGFDTDHHSPGYTRLFRRGLNGVLEEIARSRARPGRTPAELGELDAMQAGVEALIRLAGRFAELAERAAATAAPGRDRLRLERIAEAARRLPAEPPETFYQGLAFLLFLREATASLENVGISVLGRPDRLLIDLYRRDLADGRLTEAEARELIAHWLAPHDCKCFVREREWPETSTCVELGGCDAAGNPVYNELTRLFLEVHQEHHFLNPKLNCRYRADSAPDYLGRIAAGVLAGHHHYALLNDGVLIPALERAGKTPEEARNYVNGGCQETICEGVEHSAGAFFYLGLPELFHCFFTGGAGFDPETRDRLTYFMPLTQLDAPDFETLYAETLARYRQVLHRATALSCRLGRRFAQLNPCPLFSTMLAGCVERACDYTAGGARCNPSGVALLGLPDLVNALFAVRQAVYRERFITLSDLRRAVLANFRNCETLRLRLERLPRYGHGIPEVDQLAGRLAADLARLVRECPNERGEHFQPGYFVYWMYKEFGDATHATPEGRRDFDILAQGIAPSRLRPPGSPTPVIRSLAAIDFTETPGNAVLDLLLPGGNRIRPEALVALIRTAAAAGVPTLQLNCLDPEELRRARRDPEQHADLVVRIAGLSAVFVQLSDRVQEEIISRAQLAL